MNSIGGRGAGREGGATKFPLARDGSPLVQDCLLLNADAKRSTN
jgi:hypothetical protein